MVVAGFDAEFVVASSNILDEGMASNHHRRGAVGSQSAHGRSLALSRPWSFSIRLLAYRSVL